MDILHPFSDPDVDRASALLNEISDLSDRDKVEFIDGFLKAWREFKALKRKKLVTIEMPDFFVSLDDSLREAIAHKGILPRRAGDEVGSIKELGKWIGSLIGILRFQPLAILWFTRRYLQTFRK